MRSRRFDTPAWRPLDNAAQIFPPTLFAHNSNVVRLTCELEEAVDPVLLQAALEKTAEQFPLFRSELKRGLFQYYLEESGLPVCVCPENMPPCLPLYPVRRRGLLFRVLYHQRRISLEFHHTLADGTGALQFLRTLVCMYLLLRHPELPSGLDDDYDASRWQREADSFRFYSGKPGKASLPPLRAAYRPREKQLPRDCMAVLEGSVPLEQALSCARSRGVTLTELMTAVLIRSLRAGMPVRDREKPVAVTIPVNLRNYFPSQTVRNFFSTFCVISDKQEDGAILEQVRQTFRESLSAEALRRRMDTLCALERSLPLRLLPLPVKDGALRLAAAMAVQSASFSNLGWVSMPAGTERFIRQFGMFTSAGCLQACACSFKGRYVVTFASPFRSREPERLFFRELAAMGLEVTLASQLPGEAGAYAVL